MSKSSLSIGTKAWADKINAAWRQSVAEIINAGRVLLQAKDLLPHGDFEDMIKDKLDFSPQTARKLMAVAGDQRIANRSNMRDLPPHWSTLFELTKLSDDEFDQALKSGEINPKMKGADVPKKRKESPVGDAVSATAGSEIPPLAADALGTPLDDREGGDSVVTERVWDACPKGSCQRHQDCMYTPCRRIVTEQDPERAAVADLERKAPEEALNLNTGPSGVPSVDGAGSSSETNARHSAPVRMGGAHRPEAHPSGIPGSLHGEAGGSPATHPDGSVTLHVKPDAISRVSCGLALLVRASKELSPEDAVEEYPEDMRLSTDDIAYVTSWLLAFEDADKARLDAVEAAQ